MIRTIACVVLLAACDGDPATIDAGGEGGIVVRCSERDDPDQDRISSTDEGTGDADADGAANRDDTDSDGDGFLDADEGGDADCASAPIDSDQDGDPDFLDRDGNGDDLDDAEQSGDSDGDGIADRLDLDVDGDGLANSIERGDGETAIDSDGDGTPDVRDEDSDGDSIGDVHEGAADDDEDSTPNYLDLDSDGDGAEDALEAGDGLLETPPVTCVDEVNPVTGLPGSDGRADFADTDSDNDGLGDGEELAIGSGRCDIDSDDDGFSDLVEHAYARVNCPDGVSGTGCDCATSAGCGIPPTDYYLTLPYGDPPVDRDLDFATDVRIADIFILVDTTTSMTWINDLVQSSALALVDSIRSAIPDVWFSTGQHKDWPFGIHGTIGGEVAFELSLQSTDDPEEIEDGLRRNVVSGIGNQTFPESNVEALYQIATGEGGTWSGGGADYVMPHWVGDCLDMGWGAPCFRDEAMAVVIHFTDACAHNGPAGDAPECDDYFGIDPTPHRWEEAIEAMNTRGVRFIGINSLTGYECAGDSTPSGTAPCYYMHETGVATRTVDRDGLPLVFDLSTDATSDVFVETVTDAVARLAGEVPTDVTTRLVDGIEFGAEPVDATLFIKSRRPACSAIPPAATCWVAGEGVPHDEAVAATDESAFFSVLPGTAVTFRITFQNDFVPQLASSQIFVAFIDVTAGGTARLDRRQVFIVVPASPGTLE